MSNAEITDSRPLHSSFSIRHSSFIILLPPPSPTPSPECSVGISRFLRAKEWGTRPADSVTDP